MPFTSKDSAENKLIRKLPSKSGIKKSKPPLRNAPVKQKFTNPRGKPPVPIINLENLNIALGGLEGEKVTQSALAEALGVSAAAIGQSQLVYLDREGYIDIGKTLQGASVKEKTNIAVMIKEQSLAELRRLEVEQRKGQLVETSEMEAVWADVSGHVRDAILEIPDRVSKDLSLMSSPREIREYLMKEFRRTLAAIPEKIGAEIAA